MFHYVVVLGLFESDEEVAARRFKSVIIIALIIGVIGIVLLSMAAWERFKPLPQLTICEEKGYEAGAIVDGKKVCYKECVDNELSHCKLIRVMV